MLRSLLGRLPAAGVIGAIAGVIVWFLAASLVAAAVVGIVAFVLMLFRRVRAEWARVQAEVGAVVAGAAVAAVSAAVAASVAVEAAWAAAAGLRGGGSDAIWPDTGSSVHDCLERAPEVPATPAGQDRTDHPRVRGHACRTDPLRGRAFPGSARVAARCVGAGTRGRCLLDAARVGHRAQQRCTDLSPAGRPGCGDRRRPRRSRAGREGGLGTGLPDAWKRRSGGATSRAG